VVRFTHPALLEVLGNEAAIDGAATSRRVPLLACPAVRRVPLLACPAVRVAAREPVGVSGEEAVQPTGAPWRPTVRANSAARSHRDLFDGKRSCPSAG